jgi:hypothetical protein
MGGQQCVDFFGAAVAPLVLGRKWIVQMTDSAPTITWNGLQGSFGTNGGDSGYIKLTPDVTDISWANYRTPTAIRIGMTGGSGVINGMTVGISSMQSFYFENYAAGTLLTFKDSQSTFGGPIDFLSLVQDPDVNGDYSTIDSIELFWDGTQDTRAMQYSPASVEIVHPADVGTYSFQNLSYWSTDKWTSAYGDKIGIAWETRYSGSKLTVEFTKRDSADTTATVLLGLRTGYGTGISTVVGTYTITSGVAFDIAEVGSEVSFDTLVLTAPDGYVYPSVTSILVQSVAKYNYVTAAQMTISDFGYGAVGFNGNKVTDNGMGGMLDIQVIYTGTDITNQLKLMCKPGTQLPSTVKIWVNGLLFEPTRVGTSAQEFDITLPFLFTTGGTLWLYNISELSSLGLRFGSVAA